MREKKLLNDKKRCRNVKRYNIFLLYCYCSAYCLKSREGNEMGNLFLGHDHEVLENDNQKAEDEAIALLNKYILLTNTHNFDELLSIIDENASFIFTDAKCNGIKEIRAYFEKAWDEIKDEKYWITDINIIHTDQFVKILSYNFHYSGFSNGEFVSGMGKASNVFTNKNQRWVLMHEHLSNI